MTKTRLIPLLFVCTALLTGCSSSGDSGQQQAEYQSIDTVPMLIMQVQKCARLDTTE